jgi:hypothetical protein
MKLFTVFSTLALASFALAENAEKEAPKELVIDTTFKPEDCPQTAQKFDQIKVHYVCCFYISP